MEIGPGLGRLIKVGTLRQELESLSDLCVDSVAGLYRLFACYRYGTETDGSGCTATSIPSVCLMMGITIVIACVEIELSVQCLN
jgi:hypothetical protein